MGCCLGGLRPSCEVVRPTIPDPAEQELPWDMPTRRPGGGGALPQGQGGNIFEHFLFWAEPRQPDARGFLFLREFLLYYV